MKEPEAKNLVILCKTDDGKHSSEDSEGKIASVPGVLKLG